MVFFHYIYSIREYQIQNFPNYDNSIDGTTV